MCLHSTFNASEQVFSNCGVGNYKVNDGHSLLAFYVNVIFSTLYIMYLNKSFGFVLFENKRLRVNCNCLSNFTQSKSQRERKTWYICCKCLVTIGLCHVLLVTAIPQENALVIIGYI